MRPSTILTSFVLFGTALSAQADPSLAPDNVQVLRSAMAQAERGQSSRAQAALGCLLMPKGLSIGLERSGAMSRSVEQAVRVWRDRLEDCPFRFVTTGSPDVKVRFVDDIESGGDVQGQVRLQRYVRWGSSGTSYRVGGTILIRDNVEGRPLSSSEVSAVVEHELGHVLGLDDSDQPGELMGPFVPGEPVDGPTDDEAAKVADFRASIRHALADITAGRGRRSARR